MLRFLNYFLNFISKKWILICFLIALLLWIVVAIGEGNHRISRGKEIDAEFMGICVQGLLTCLGITFGIYLIVLMLILVIALKSYQNFLLADVTNVNRILDPFKTKIALREGEEQVFATKGKLKIRDRFGFRVAVRITNKGLFIDGGVLSLRKYMNGLSASYYDQNGGSACFAFEDIQSVYPEIKEEVTLLVRLKNEKTLQLSIPPDQFKTSFFPASIRRSY